MDIDLLIIIVFLVTTLAIGLYCSRSVTTFKDYAVGSRNMSTWVITISLIATIYGGNFLHTQLTGYYYQGLYMFILSLGSPLRFYLASRFILVRMKEWLGDFSIAESMGRLCGRPVQVLTAIFGIIVAIAQISAQFKISLIIIESIPFCNVTAYANYCTVILGVLVTIYTILGGARSTALTDIYQFCFFSVCLPILTFTFLYHAQSPWINWQKFVNMSQFNLSQIATWDTSPTWDNSFVHLFTYFIWHSIFTFDPAQIQRFYMSSSIQQATKIFLKSGIIRIIFSLLFLVVIAALYISGNSVPPKQKILDYIMQLNHFPGMKGLLITSVIALCISTVDSYLHTGSVLFANDIWPFITGKREQTDKYSLKIVRISSGLIGIVTILITLHMNNIRQFLSKVFYFYTPSVTVPMIMACFGFRPRGSAVLWSMGINTARTVYNIFIKEQAIRERDVFLSLIYGASILLILHYLLPKKSNTGWVGIPDDSPVKLQNQEIKRWYLRKLYYFKSIFTKSYWKDIFPKSSTIFMTSGIYFIIYSSILLFYVKPVYVFSYIYWYIAVMVIGTIVTIYPTFHAYKKKDNSLLHGLWPILLFVVLFISGIIYMKLSYFSPMSCALFIVNIGISSLLLPSTIIIVMLSVLLLIYKWLPPHVAIVSYKAWITTETMIGLTILLSCLVYRYIRNKTNRQLQTIALTKIYDQQYALASIHNQEHWNRLDPTYSGKVLQDMADELGLYSESLPIQQHQKKLYVFRQSLLKRAKEERTSTLDSKSIHKVNIEDMILKSYETVRKLDIPIQLLLTKKTKEKYLLTEPTTFERLLTINFLNLCQDKYTTYHTVYLNILDTLLSYPFHKPSQETIHSAYEKQLKSPILSALAFSISTDTDSLNVLPVYEVTDEITSVYLPKTINNLYQEESRQIVQAHGGYIQTIETETSLTCLYILPIDDTKVMRFKRYHTDDLSNKVAETLTSLSQEKELISLLIKQTTLTEKEVRDTIHFIKKAHGNTIRKSGEPYYTHPMAVAKIVLEDTNNSDTILAALLHDIVEDTMVTLEQIELLYGIEVAYIVDMVTHYNTYGLRWKLDDSDNQSILNKCKDIRVIQIKLADRLHNLRTIAVRKPIDKIRIAKETLLFYIPWARKNNIICWLPEIENICEQILHINPTQSDIPH
ncbi:sodium:solute symporter family transporter [Cardinium endosymbiont of Culicoides punctatus]|uniref:sodium:solute symporter family transporter n=1 Tax=Cardinium endosymbiont of Culicoides punctatus TaxID=2304601 RepID=UPI001058BDC2|nr:HD domain-containing protein [Cardinium endosymbiont of Culicoides punctatus]TDG94790.1 Bifunctional (p)ppGpp synthase/hydrolase SpoT [Cardinium endosymbiont of Culicoides punctatus]